MKHDRLFMPHQGPQIARPEPNGESTEYRRFDDAHIALLSKILIDSVSNRAPDFIIGQPAYLIRWWLRRERDAGSTYLHKILRDDDDRALHDHPW